MAPRPDPSQYEPEHQAERRTRGPMRWALYLLALGLLGACVWLAYAGTRTETGESGFAHLADAEPMDAVYLAAAIVGQILLNGLAFWALTKPFRTTTPVGPGEMSALIAATSLLNYLPMRAGLIGRAAYLKQQHGMEYRVSVLMMMMAAGGTSAIYLVVLAATLWRQAIDPLWWTALLTALAFGTLITPLAARLVARLTPGADVSWFSRVGLAGFVGIFAVMCLRLVDLLVGAIRLYLAARILGQPIAYETAVVLGVAGMFVTLATPLPNGLGLREGLYGVLAKLGVGGALLTGATGVAIGLIDRAVEAIVFTLTGFAALAFLHRRARRDSGKPRRIAA